MRVREETKFKIARRNAVEENKNAHYTLLTTAPIHEKVKERFYRQPYGRIGGANRDKRSN